MEPKDIQQAKEFFSGILTPEAVDSLPKDTNVYKPEAGLGALNKYDVGITPYLNTERESYRASNQSGWEQLGNWAVQSLGTIAGQAIEGTGYLLDFQQHLNMIKGTEDEFSNWLSDMGKNITEGAAEAFPIYEHNPGGFNPGDSGWWFKNGVSLASTLSLLIPARAAVGISSKIGKGLGLSGKLSESASLATKGVAGALFSRTMENTMEASQTFESIYQQQLGNGLSEEEAKASAAEGARQAWYQNSINLIWDIPQYMFIFKGSKALGLEAKELKKLVGKKAFAEYAKQGLQEGIEEATQFVIGKEAEASQLRKDDSTFEDRLVEYLRDPELYNSAFFGALGGTVFSVAGRKFEQVLQKKGLIQQDTKEAVANLRTNLEEQIKAQESRDIIASNADNLDKVKQELEIIAQDPEADKNQVETFNKQVQTFEQVKSTIPTSVSPEYATIATSNAVAANDLSNSINNINSNLNEIKNDPIVKSHLDKTGQEAFDFSVATNKLNSLRKVGKAYKNPNDVKIIEALEKQYQQELDSIEGKFNSAIPTANQRIQSLTDILVDTEIRQQIAQQNYESIVNGDNSIYDSRVEKKNLEDISNENDVDKLYELSTQDNEIAKVAKKRLNDLYKSESKMYPDSEQLDSSNDWVDFYKNNRATFLAHQKNIFKLDNPISLEEFQNRFEEFKPQLQELVSKNKVNTETEKKLDEIDNKEVQDINKDIVNEPIIEEFESEVEASELPATSGFSAKSNDVVTYLYESPEGSDPYIIFTDEQGFHRLTILEFKEKYKLISTEKGYHTLYTKDGNPVFWNDQDIDRDFLRNIYKITNKTIDQHDIYVQVDMNYEHNNFSNKKAKPSDLKIAYVIKHENKDYVIGHAPAIRSNITSHREELINFRNIIYNQVKNASGVIELNQTFKITTANKGRIWKSNNRISNLNSLTNEPYILSVFSKDKLRLNVPDGFATQREIDELETKNNLSEGAVYMIVRNPFNNKLSPIRLFTKKLNRSAKASQEVKSILSKINKDNWKSSRDKAMNIIRWKDSLGNYQPNFYFKNNELHITISNPRERESQYLSSNTSRIVGLNTYVFNADKINELGIENIIYDGLDLGDKTIQINSAQLNDPLTKYNEKIIDNEYLETDINPYQHWHSPKFSVDMSTISPTSTIVSVKFTETIPSTSTKETEKKEKIILRIQKVEKTIEELEQLQQEVNTEKIIEQEVTEEEIEQIAKEEGVAKEEVKEKIKNEVVLQMNTKIFVKPKTTLQKVADKIKKILLNFMIVVASLNGISFNPINSQKSLTYDNIEVSNLKSFDDIYLSQEEINKKENIDIIISTFKRSNEQYLIVDKNAAVAHLFKGDSLITTYEVGTGKIKGDEQTKTVVKNGKVLWEQGNRQTGAGIFTVSNKGKYKSSPSYTLKNEAGIEVPTVLHETLSNRKKLFKDNNPDNNRMSYGCINFQAKSLKDLGNNPDFKSGSKVFVLPDNKLNKFQIKDGKLTFQSNDINVNRTPNKYVAQPAVFKADDVTEEGKEFLLALSDNKEQLMKLYPTISNDEYNQIAKITYGIFGQESSFGTYGGLRGQYGRIKDEMALLLTNADISMGVAQTRLSSIPQKVKEFFGINKTRNLRNIENAAIGAMAVSLDIYINQIPDNKKEDFKELIPLGFSNRGFFVKAVKGDKSQYKNVYVKNVNENADLVDVFIGTPETKQSLPIDSTNKKFSTLLFLLELRRRRNNGEDISDDIQKEIDRLKQELESLKLQLKALNKGNIKVSKKVEKPKEQENIDFGEEGIKFKVLSETNKPLQSIPEAQKWLRDKLNVEATIIPDDQIDDFVDRMGYMAQRGGQHVLGFMYNAAIYLNDKAIVGTSQHEAFHLVFNYALSSKEQANMLAYGTEEELADRFADYVVTQQEKSSYLNRVFKKLYLFLKNLITPNRLTLDEFFWQIDNGAYRNINFKKNVDIFKPKIEGMHPKVQKDRIRLINRLFLKGLDDLRLENPELKESQLFKLALSNDLYKNYVIPQLNKKKEIVLLKYENGEFNGLKYAPEVYRDTAINRFNQTIDNLVDDNGNRGILYNEALRDLRRFGIIVNTIGGKDIIENEEDGMEMWMKENVKHSAIESFTYELKKGLNTLPMGKFIGGRSSETGYRNIKWLSDDLGYEMYEDGDEIYSKLLEHLSNSLSVDEMMDRLTELTEIYPWAIALYNDLETGEGEFIKNPDLFKTQLWYNGMQLATPQFKVQVRNSDGTYSLVNANEKNLTNHLIKSWKENIEGIITKPDVSNLNDLDLTKDQNKFVRLANEGGIDINVDIVNVIVANGEEKQLKSFTKEAIEGSNEDLKSLARLVKNYFPQYYQPSHNNVDGEKVYNHIRSNHLHKQIEEFKRGKVDKFKDDKFYSGQPNLETLQDGLWLQRFTNSKYRSKLDYALVDGIGGQESKQFQNFTPKEFSTFLLNSFWNGSNGMPKQSNNNLGKAYYSVQLFADSSTHALLGFESYTKESLISKLSQVAKNEYYAVKQGNPNNIKNYNPKFNFFKHLNDNKNIDNLIRNEDNLQSNLESYMNKLVKEELQYYEEVGIIFKENGTYKSNVLDNRITNIEEFIEQFVWNDFYAQTQITSLFYGNLSFYKGSADFFKRAKEIWSPGNYLDDSKINKQFFVGMVEDISVVNEDFIEAIEQVLDKDVANMYRKGSSITDGQGIIDIDRWREIELGRGTDPNKVESIYNKIISDEADISDIEYVLNPYKPFFYTTHVVNGQVVPLQIKNSEFVLLPQMAKNNPKLQQVLDKINELKKITKLNGSINFNSAVKVGEHNTASDVSSISNYTLLNNSDYRIQGEVPEHQIDTDNLLGTQLRKLIVGDLDNDSIYFDGLNGSQIKEEFNNLILGNIRDKAKALQSKFEDVNEFYKMLQEEAISRDYPEKYIQALNTYKDEEGNIKTNLPLYHPLIIDKSVALIASIYRNNITKIKFPGASLSNVTSYGQKRRPKVVFNKDGSIKHFEAYMPITNSKLHKYLKDNDLLDPKELEKLGLDMGVAYRIPTEHKYSMIPIKIIGFSNAGLILPNEISTITGLDFDIDKMYVMTYSFDMVEGKPVKSMWNSNPTYEQYKERILNTKQAQRLLKEYDTIDNILSNAEELSSTLKDFFNVNSEEEILEEEGILLSVEEWNKLSIYEKNTKKARDNRILDIGISVLNNPNTTKNQLVPGGFDRLEKLANELDSSKEDNDPMIASNRSRVFNNMMAGKALIGIAANYNATHQLMQGQSLTLNDPVRINDQLGTDLGLKYVMGTNTLVTTEIAQFLASFVDNGKNPLANKYNMNIYTADVAFLIVKMFGMEAAMRFIAHPAIKEFYNKYIELGGDTKAEQAAIDILADKYSIPKKFTGKNRQPVPNININDIVNNTVSNSEMLHAFLYYKKNQAKDLSNLVSAMKVADNGMSATIEDTIFDLDKINDVLDNSDIEGVFEYFNDDTLLTTNMVEEGITNPMSKMTTDLGFPTYNDGSYQSIRDYFNNQKSSGNLSTKELKLIHATLMNFMSSNYSKLQDISLQTLVIETPKLLMGAKAHQDSPYSKFVSSLTTKPSKIDNTKSIIKLESGQTRVGEEDISEQWRLMLSDNSLIPNTNTAYADFALQLIQYSYRTKGFRFGVGSLSHIQPIEFYTTLYDNNSKLSFSDYITQQLEASANSYDYLNNFSSQFVRNYFPRLSFIRTADPNIDSIKVEDDVPYTIFATENIKTKDNKYPDYIKYKHENKWYLFQHDSQNQYVPISPLGLYNEFEEWNMSTPHPETKFKINNVPETLAKKADNVQEKPVHLSDENTISENTKKALDNTNQSQTKDQGSDEIPPCA